MRVFRFSFGENMKNPCKTTEKSNHPVGRTVYRGYSNFLLNMAFTSSSEVKKYLYFMSGEATNEINIFFTSQVK